MNMFISSFILSDLSNQIEKKCSVFINHVEFGLFYNMPLKSRTQQLVLVIYSSCLWRLFTINSSHYLVLSHTLECWSFTSYWLVFFYGWLSLLDHTLCLLVGRDHGVLLWYECLMSCLGVPETAVSQAPSQRLPTQARSTHHQVPASAECKLHNALM